MSDPASPPPEPTLPPAAELAPAAKPEPAASPVVVALVAVAIAIVNFVGFVLLLLVDAELELMLAVLTALALAQLVVGGVALVRGIRAARAKQRGGVAAAVIGGLAGVGAVVGWAGGAFLTALAAAGAGMAGGAWGRPLRIRGRQLHPNLCDGEGSDWTRGAEPDPRGLDGATRAALEALWLHDAQKEHASVPAFSRISWLLAAVGAPAELLEGAHRAALEEIEHARLCFALAAGYGGRRHGVEAMPELLLGGEAGVAGVDDPLVTLAVESLADGCQLEDFNADVAAACAELCTEPATRAVLETIAVEERSHAELSWALLDWVLARDSERVAPAIVAALAQLDRYPRPTAVSADKLELVARAEPAALRAHGRLPDARWAELWDLRLAATRRRVAGCLAAAGQPAAA